jgi:cytochrome P450
VSAADSRVEDLLPFADPHYWADPYPYYERARAAGDGLYESPAGVYVLLGHADILELVRDPRMSARELSFGVGDRFHDSVLGQDPPDHTRLRRVFQKWFTAARVQEWTADTQARLDAALAAAEAGDGTIDLVDDYAFPATFGTISTIFGVPTDEAIACRHHTYVIGRALAPGANDADMAAGEASLDWYYAYVRGLVAVKRRSPGDDLLSAFIAAHDSGTMREDEVLATMTLLYAVGHLDNTYLIANGVLQLLADEPLRRRYVDDPGVRGATVLELLRHETPEQFVVRAAAASVEVRGTEIPHGAVVMMMIGAANRDPAVFDAPARLDIDRPNLSRQLAFGSGIHACIGSALARAQGQAGITSIVTRYPAATPTGDTEYGHTEFLRVLRHATIDLRGNAR